MSSDPAAPGNQLLRQKLENINFRWTPTLRSPVTFFTEVAKVVANRYPRSMHLHFQGKRFRLTVMFPAPAQLP